MDYYPLASKRQTLQTRLTITAIELTLKTQKEFDGNFFISLLETLVKSKLKNRGAAIRFVKEQELIAI